MATPRNLRLALHPNSDGQMGELITDHILRAWMNCNINGLRFIRSRGFLGRGSSPIWLISHSTWIPRLTACYLHSIVIKIDICYFDEDRARSTEESRIIYVVVVS
jgi:hypothetical protein